MIVLPPEFVMIVYPGYFYNQKNGQLYSCKRGTLKPLALQTYAKHRRGFSGPYYSVSVKGKRKFLSKSFLQATYGIESKPPQLEIFPQEG
jgi:hypothetical protein